MTLGFGNEWREPKPNLFRNSGVKRNLSNEPTPG